MKCILRIETINLQSHLVIEVDHKGKSMVHMFDKAEVPIGEVLAKRDYCIKFIEDIHET